MVWNERLTDTDSFSKRYENLLLNYSADYRKVDHRRIDDGVLSSFYSSYKVNSFKNMQKFDFEGLKGRMLSSSYVPKKGHGDYPRMIEELKIIFDETNIDGKLNMEYKTLLYYGVL